jgi:hypothetical protein
MTTSRHGFLLFIAGLGGLLYGIDVGIVADTLPDLESTHPIRNFSCKK